jgi:hypothetical protein
MTEGCDEKVMYIRVNPCHAKHLRGVEVQIHTFLTSAFHGA